MNDCNSPEDFLNSPFYLRNNTKAVARGRQKSNTVSFFINYSAISALRKEMLGIVHQGQLKTKS